MNNNDNCNNNSNLLFLVALPLCPDNHEGRSVVSGLPIRPYMFMLGLCRAGVGSMLGPCWVCPPRFGVHRSTARDPLGERRLLKGVAAAAKRAARPCAHRMFLWARLGSLGIAWCHTTINCKACGESEPLEWRFENIHIWKNRKTPGILKIEAGIDV